MGSEAPRGWTPHPLYELAAFINGRATKPAEVADSGVPVIKIAELTRGITASTNRVPKGNIQEKHWVRDGDLLFAWSGSVGIHIYRGEPAALNQHIFRVESGAGVDQRFLRYCLEAQLPVFRGFVESKRTTMGHVTVADLKATSTPIPPLEEQRAIASVLGALDDKIDSNRRLSQLLETAAGLLFENLFHGRIGAGACGDAHWQMATLGEVVEINPRVSLVRGQEAPFVEMAALEGFGTRPSEVVRKKYTGGAKFERGDTLFARITPSTEHGKGAFVDFVEEPSFGSTEFIVMRPGPLLTPEAVFLLSRNARLRDLAILSMSGSSGRQRVSVDALKQFPLAVPRERASWSNIAAALGAIFRQSRGLWNESAALRATRDTVLPKLVSGQLRVRDIASLDEVQAA